MPSLVNPYDKVPHDYLAERYAASRQSLIDDFGVTNNQAALRLTNIWLNHNALDREEWDHQIQAEELLARQHEEQEEGEEQARQEEGKKNCNKFLHFADVDVPISTEPPIISPLAQRKLRKGELCELYFFMNKGLADAQATAHSTDDEDLTLMQDDQGLHSFVPLASAKAKQNVVEDKDLTWQQIDEATYRIFTAMKECGWDEPRIQAHLQSWLALGTHSWRHHQDERRRRALIHYQAVARRDGTTPSAPRTRSTLCKYIQQSLLDDIRCEIVDNAAAIAANSAREATDKLSAIIATLQLSGAIPTQFHSNAHNRHRSSPRRPPSPTSPGECAHKRSRSFLTNAAPTNPATELLHPCAVCLSVELHTASVAECDKDETGRKVRNLYQASQQTTRRQSYQPRSGDAKRVVPINDASL